MKKNYLQPATVQSPLNAHFSLCVGSVHGEIPISGGDSEDPGEPVAPLPGRF